MWHLAEPNMMLLGLLPLGLGLFFFLKRRSAKRPTLLAFSKPGDAIKREIRRTRWTFRALFAFLLLGFLLLAFVIARPIRVESWTKK